MIANILMILLLLLILYSVVVVVGKTRSFDNGSLMNQDATGSLRGFVILMITMAHICQYENRLKEILIGGGTTYRFVLSWGAIGVSIFFFLSGYGCYLSVRKKDNIWKWLGQHIIKMIVHYIIAFIIVIVLLLLAFQQKIEISEIARNLVTLQLPGSTVWYFKIQILFYIILTFAVAICKNKAWILVFFMSLAYAIIAKYALKLPDYWWKTALCFAGGCFVAQFHNLFTAFTKKLWARILCILFVIICYFLIMKDGHYRIYVQLPVYLVIAFAITIIWCWLIRENKVYRHIGNLSLDIYLIHVGIVESVFLLDMDINLKISLFILISGVFTILSYYLSEAVVKKINSIVNVTN